MIRAVLFDAVGTLIELREPVGESYARAAAGHGVSVSAWRLGDAFRRAHAAREPAVFAGLPAAERARLEREWWRALVRETFRAADSSQPVARFDALFEELWRHFSAPDAWRVRPGAAELLARLAARGLALAVVSNFDGRLPALLEALGLAAHLDAVVLPGDAGAAKPDRRIFTCALARLGVGAEEALFVGDDALRDLEAARALGLRAVDAASLATLGDLDLDFPGVP